MSCLDYAKYDPEKKDTQKVRRNVPEDKSGKSGRTITVQKRRRRDGVIPTLTPARTN